MQLRSFPCVPMDVVIGMKKQLIALYSFTSLLGSQSSLSSISTSSNGIVSSSNPLTDNGTSKRKWNINDLL